MRLLLVSSLLLGLCLACSGSIGTSQTEMPAAEDAEEEASSEDDASRDRSRRGSTRRGSSENRRGVDARRPRSGTDNRSGSGSKSGTDRNDDGSTGSDTCCCEIQPTDAGPVRYEIVSRSSCPSQGDGGKCLSSMNMCQ